MSIIITNRQEFDQFYKDLDTHKDIRLLTIYIALDQTQIQELKSRLPNTTISYNEPQDEDSEDEDEHGACSCHRNDRYE